MGNTHSKIPSDSPLGCLLHNLTKLGLKGDLKQTNLICFSTQYRLDKSLKWPKFGTFDPSILWDLDNFIVRNGKWQEAPHLHAFFYSSPNLPFVQMAAPSKSFVLILTPPHQLLFPIPFYQLLIQILQTNPFRMGPPSLNPTPSPLSSPEDSSSFFP
jgi:hypothetical protein